MRSINRQYNWQMAVISVFYLILLPLSIGVTKAIPDNPLRFATTLIPIVPIAGWIIVFYRYLIKLDELQRRINLEALGISVACVGLLTFSVGLLDSAGVAQPYMVLVFPSLILFWGFARIIVERRYE